MKHLLTVIAVAALTSVAAIAADSAPALQYGVHGGLNFGKWSGQGVTDGINAAQNAGATGVSTGSETGIVAGVVVQYPLMDYLALQPELNFIQKGASLTATANGTTATDTTKLSYLELPVMLKAQYNLGGVKPFVEAGPKIGLLLAASDTNNTANLKDGMNSIDFGFDFGVGAAVPVADNVDVYVEGRYGLGITNVDNSGNAVNNNGFQVQIGVLF